MAKVSWQNIPYKERHAMIRSLAKLLLSIETERDMVQLIYRLFTESEIIMLGRRMQIGERMVNGFSYESIREELGVGFGTIKSVDRWLEHAMRDYQHIRQEQVRQTKQAKKYQNVQYGPALPGTLEHLRHSRPGQFALLNLLIDNLQHSKVKSKPKSKSQLKSRAKSKSQLRPQSKPTPRSLSPQPKPKKNPPQQ